MSIATTIARAAGVAAAIKVYEQCSAAAAQRQRLAEQVVVDCIAIFQTCSHKELLKKKEV
ncbi:unnamed protein product [Ceratitis capitata]|uniref:(Mediterranean fruit fly) hypothetical protein n=1 Tax=Ceratitis capitata TaxID=7213 RepID=A0A811ULA4_CERCA|nr:unnamed protein product [Ceratitis capitata]